MTRMKKLASLLLAMVMAFALAVPALAADEYVMGIAPGNTHEYTVFQIFTGTPMAEGSDKFAPDSVEWGYAMNESNRTQFVSLLQADATIGEYFTDMDGTTEAETVAAAINRAIQNEGESAVGKIVANAAYDVLKDKTNAASATLDAAHPDVTLPAGYYFIYDNTLNNEDARILHRLVANVNNIKAKDSKEPTLTKKVLDSDSGEWVDVTDYNIGDTFHFQITAVLPDNYATLSTYFLEFTDTQADGFKKPESVTVYAIKADGTRVDFTPADYALNLNPTAPATFTLNISNMKGEDSKFADLGNGAKVILEYETQLLEDAVIGGAGNVNEVHLDYTGDGTGLDDDATVFTFEFEANKIDGVSKGELNGAGFTLNKLVDGEWVLVKTIEPPTEEELEADPNAGVNKFTFTGLKAGRYQLIEDQAPTGYNKLEDPIYFEVIAEYETDTSGNQVVKSLSIVKTNAEGNPIEDGKPGDTTTGQITMDVENNKGLLLPEAGGIGTTIFYILGGILVVGAAVLLITKRRMGASEE